MERSLKQLQVEQLDSLLIHRPSPLMDPHEITEAVKSLVKEGKSNRSVCQILTNLSMIY